MLSKHPRLKVPAVLLAAAATAALTLPTAVAAHASAATPVCSPDRYTPEKATSGQVQRLVSNTVKYYIDETGQPYPWASNDIKAALNTWSNQPSSTLKFAYAGTTKATNTQDGISTISWRNKKQLPATPSSGPAGWTMRYPVGGAPITEFDIVLNTDHHFANFQIPGTYDTQTIALHESGHALGLDHVTCPESVMITGFNYMQQVRTPSAGDLRGLRSLYPMQTVPYPIPLPAPNRTAVTSYDEMRPGAPHNGYFINAWQPFTAQSNRITYLAATVGNSAFPGGASVPTAMRMRLCTTPACTTILADKTRGIVNYGATAVDIGDVQVNKGSTYYIVWYQPASASGHTWVTYWWGPGGSISASSQMQAAVRGYNA